MKTTILSYFIHVEHHTQECFTLYTMAASILVGGNLWPSLDLLEEESITYKSEV